MRLHADIQPCVSKLIRGEKSTKFWAVLALSWVLIQTSATPQFYHPIFFYVLVDFDDYILQLYIDKDIDEDRNKYMEA